MKIQITPERYVAVDDYFSQVLLADDTIPAKVLAHCEAHAMPAIQVAPNQGKLLNLLVRMKGARRILELGTLGAYSTVWMALGMGQDGRLVTLDFDENYLKVARESLRIAGVADRVEIRVGRAAESMQALIDEGAAPFDFIFLDADKENNPQYLALALKLSAPGTVIVADNVVRQGQILDAHSDGGNIQGLRRFFDDMAGNEKLSATAFQTVGSKGWDGLSVAIVNS
ncbi:O-methyltransferase [Advenella kashmirensis]|uniref:O-methyltransferase n=1 Tax=Advenella kashmirensis TaxID=310575 RepID=UPI000429A660|nr:O-methyltransferase [Advenella kashmirensis]